MTLLLSVVSDKEGTVRMSLIHSMPQLGTKFIKRSHTEAVTSRNLNEFKCSTVTASQNNVD